MLQMLKGYHLWQESTNTDSLRRTAVDERHKHTRQARRFINSRMPGRTASLEAKITKIQA